MLVEKGFYDKGYNPDGTGITHQYEPKTINGDKVVIDHTTALTWQQSGSDGLPFESAQAYIKELNMGFEDALGRRSCDCLGRLDASDDE